MLLVGFGDLTELAAEAARRFPDRVVATARSAAEGLRALLDDRRYLPLQGLVQPVYLLPGFEYDKILRETQEYAATSTGFTKINLRVGEPLLGANYAGDRERLRSLAGLLARRYGQRDTLLVGHGTRHPAGALYGALVREINECGGALAGWGLLDGDPDFAAVSQTLLSRNLSALTLAPLLLTSGRHLREEIIGDAPASWRRRLEALGIEVDCVDRGLLTYPEVREMLLDSISYNLSDTYKPFDPYSDGERG
jgi:sirohydrochlorin cobaltochelatase